MKGIILAGGVGTRLNPLTVSVSKQLLPVFDKPMIYYPLCTLLSGNIRDILCITTPDDEKNFKKLLGTGKQWGINIEYAQQAHPNGIAESFLIGQNFIGDDSVSLILGDNIFYGINFEDTIKLDKNQKFNGARLFAYKVNDPERYGVIELNRGKAVSITEKPKKPNSSYVVTGLYIYDNNVIEIAKKIVPSKRNELEITDVNNYYIKNNTLEVTIMKQGMVWMDVGTTSSLLQAAQFIQSIQERQKTKVSCPEELCWRKKWITDNEFENLAAKAPQNSYGKYLRKLCEQDNDIK